MAGRPAIFDREEQRKNQVVVPMTEQEKRQLKEAAEVSDRSMASFVRMVLNEYFAGGVYVAKSDAETCCIDCVYCVTNNEAPEGKMQYDCIHRSAHKNNIDQWGTSCGCFRNKEGF